MLSRLPKKGGVMWGNDKVEKKKRKEKKKSEEKDKTRKSPKMPSEKLGDT